jgi:hypothetical protein
MGLPIEPNIGIQTGNDLVMLVKMFIGNLGDKWKLL